MGGRGASSYQTKRDLREAIAQRKYKKVGVFDITKYTNEFETTTNEVILTTKQKEHIKEEHPEALKYLGNMTDILTSPDGVYKENSKQDTVWLVKAFDNNVKVTMKLNVANNKKEQGFKNSIIQMQIMPQKRIDNYEQKGRITKLNK